MSAMPVVWCTNPNSSEKPTAFALQGIQLQGNISDQHVLAVQELIAAASEGRLILPSDGTVMLLDCGVGVGSVVVNGTSSSSSSSVLCDTLASNKIKTKAEVHTIKEESDEEIDVSINKPNKNYPENCDTKNTLYEFLCCAKCMSDGVSRCKFSNRRKRSVNNEKIIAKYLDKTRRHSSSTTQVARGVRKNSFKHSRVGATSSVTTATINNNNTGRCSPHHRKASLPVELMMTKSVIGNKITQNLLSIDESTITSNNNNNNNCQQETTTSRKTSLDSICTVSSLDSGFIEMQNKKSSIASEGENNDTGANTPEAKSADKEVLGCHTNNSKLINSNNSGGANSTQQSRNRRKSYEEFKSMFRQNNERCPPLLDTCSNKLEIVSEVNATPPPTISRRKSYEEFKALVKICDNDLHSATSTVNNSDYKSVVNSVYNNNSTVYDAPMVDDSTINEGSMKRKNSKRHSLSKKDRLMNIFLNNKITETQNNKIYDIIQKKTENGKNQNNDRLDKYRSKNFKIYDKFISYGTIYDIIQKKAEIYDTDFKQFEKYMTYGTIYEILRHKSEPEFPRRRVFSEKIYRQLRNNLLLDNIGHRYSTIHESMPSQRISNALTNKESSAASTTDVWNNTNTLSTIYDILQTSKNRNLGTYCDIDDKSNKNRFLVNKVSEDDLKEEQKTEIPEVKITPPKKQTKLRRFSNILSYKRDSTITPTHKKSTVSTPDLQEFAAKDETFVKNTNQFLNIPNLPDSATKTDELYSRINKLNLNAEKKSNAKKDKENRIFKSSSSHDISSHRTRDDVDSGILSSNAKIALKVPPSRSERKISANAKIISDKQQFSCDGRVNSEKTRRLSEFTRGEFLNEKA